MHDFLSALAGDAFYWVVNSRTAIATDRRVAETVATVDSTPMARSTPAKTTMIGVAVRRPSCASLMMLFFRFLGRCWHAATSIGTLREPPQWSLSQSKEPNGAIG
jgi:hypothetical protein